MRRTRFFILPILCALICFPVCAQEEATTGTINGRVVNERGEAMAGASVVMRTVGTLNQGRSTTSDAEGNFRFDGLEPALYIITGYAPAYIVQSTETDSAERYHRIGDSVRLEFIKGGVITGTVTNAAGEPVVGVRVRAFRVRDPKGPAAQLIQYGSMDRATDDRGIYRIYGLSPGTYVVTAGGVNNQFQFNPFDTDVPIYSPSSTRDTATEYAVRGGEETTADIRYRSEAGRTISGTIRVTGNNGASVMVFSSDGMMIPTSNGFQQPGARGFAIEGLADGEYTLFAQEMAAGSQGTATTIPDILLSETKRVTIKGADVTGIELATRPLSAISGVIALEPSKAPECQGKRKPEFGEMIVELQQHEKDSDVMAPILRMFSPSTTPNQKGAFSMRNVSPARYRFNPRFYARYWYLQSISTGA
ncbi:MAG TPA: carboxypeptidase-like regulatory domain-containing protein, partial [Pyrinomonadaceae bacterium]|nr:carboxypeptidase-like regulatory domain-containing protein [Pyrinomonadaceae bacterium]